MWSTAVKTVAVLSRKQMALASVQNLTWRGADDLAGVVHYNSRP